jgi:hypothetical protein
MALSSAGGRDDGDDGEDWTMARNSRFAKSAVAFSALLAEGIGDTIRVSLAKDRLSCAARSSGPSRIVEALLEEGLKIAGAAPSS